MAQRIRARARGGRGRWRPSFEAIFGLTDTDHSSRTEVALRISDFRRCSTARPHRRTARRFRRRSRRWSHCCTALRAPSSKCCLAARTDRPRASIHSPRRRLLRYSNTLGRSPRRRCRRMFRTNVAGCRAAVLLRVSIRWLRCRWRRGPTSWRPSPCRLRGRSRGGGEPARIVVGEPHLAVVFLPDEGFHG